MRGMRQLLILAAYILEVSLICRVFGVTGWVAAHPRHAQLACTGVQKLIARPHHRCAAGGGGMSAPVRTTVECRQATALPEHVDRRTIALSLTSLISPAVLSEPSTAIAAGASNGAVAVLGAGGRTGRLIVEQLKAEGKPVLALSRAQADVVKASAEELAEIVRGASSVIFAASTSNKGGNSVEVDERAAVKGAMACVLAGVPKYVLISSGGVARPGSLGYVATNWMPGATWGVMDAKARGEEGAKAAVRGTKTSYVVLRPGGLEDSPALGAAAMEVNQGDAVGGLVSRADVAAAAVAAAESPETNDTTFELYAYGAAFAQQPGPTDIGLPSGPTGYERRGSTWTDIFRGLKRDFSKL